MISDELSSASNLFRNFTNITQYIPTNLRTLPTTSKELHEEFEMLLAESQNAKNTTILKACIKPYYKLQWNLY